MENREYTDVGDFDDRLRADFAKEILESNNISCIILGRSQGLLDFNTLTMIRLRISKQDEKSALELLEVFFPGSIFAR